MRFAGVMKRVGRFWAADVPLLGLHTQGRSRREAREMVADALETLVNREGFAVQVIQGGDGYFEVSASDISPLVAMMLSHLRAASGLTLAQVASRLGARSHNAYARYEPGSKRAHRPAARQAAQGRQRTRGPGHRAEPTAMTARGPGPG